MAVETLASCFGLVLVLDCFGLGSRAVASKTNMKHRCGPKNKVRREFDASEITTAEQRWLSRKFILSFSKDIPQSYFVLSFFEVCSKILFRKSGPGSVKHVGAYHLSTYDDRSLAMTITRRCGYMLRNV